MIIFAALTLVTNSAPVCLNHVAKERGIEISDYDRSHDVSGQSSISCNFGLTPSEAQEDLNEIVNAKSCRQLRVVSNIPLGVELLGGQHRWINARRFCLYSARIHRFIQDNRASFKIENLDLVGYRGAFLLNDKILVNIEKSNLGRDHLKLVAIGPI